MTLKELDVELKSIVDKYLKIIPAFNTGDFLIDFVSRNKYTTENKDFLNEINTVVDFYLTDKNDLTMREKEQWKNLKKYYEKKIRIRI